MSVDLQPPHKSQTQCCTLGTPGQVRTCGSRLGDQRESGKVGSPKFIERLYFRQRHGIVGEDTRGQLLTCTYTWMHTKTCAHAHKPHRSDLKLSGFLYIYMSNTAEDL